MARAFFVFTLILFFSTLVLAVPSFDVPHAVTVLDIFPSPSSLTCVSSLTFNVELKNLGKSEELVTVELLSSTLGIDEVTLIPLRPGNVDLALFTVAFDTSPRGNHEFEVLLQYNQQTTSRFKTFTFTCDDTFVTPPQPLTLTSVLPPSPLPAEVHYTFSFLFSLTLLVVVLLLALTTLIVIFNKKIY